MHLEDQRPTGHAKPRTTIRLHFAAGGCIAALRRRPLGHGIRLVTPLTNRYGLGSTNPRAALSTELLPSSPARRQRC